MRAIAPNASISTEIFADAPPLRDQGGAAQELVFALTGNNTPQAVPYAAEGGLFQECGFPVVLCGPGSIDQAPPPHEYIAVSQFKARATFLAKLAATFASQGNAPDPPTNNPGQTD